MKTRALALLLSAAAASVGAVERTSERTFVHVDTSSNSFWRTASSRTVTVPIDLPNGVSSAQLMVTGLGYSRVYDVTEPSFTFDLPAASTSEGENVYDLVLKSGDVTLESARFGLIAGQVSSVEGATRCLVNPSPRKWSKAKGRLTVPIPFGMTSLTVDGVPVDTKLGGAQGWFALEAPAYGETKELSLSDGGQVAQEVELLGAGGGLTLQVR